MVLMALLACLLLVTSAMAKEFDWAVANTSIWLSTATYCPTEIYRNRTFIGYSAGFVLTDSIISEQYDVQGFVGHMPSQKAIYVAYRGSSSIPNWLDNINTFSKDYKLCAGCTVHTGFYQAEQIVIDSVEAMVRRQLTAHPNYRLIVTGHSLGAALATFTVLDLLSRNLTAQLMTFGSPRVGNRLFAEYASKVIADSSRVTHYKDIVPHLPWSERFQHISGEWYEDPSGLKECVGFEDVTCAYQWYVTSIDDHVHYLGLACTYCESVSLPQEYMPPRRDDPGALDPPGRVILRDGQ